MAYLLASLNILAHCTVNGDGIHLHSSAPTQPPSRSPLSLCINLLSTVRYCKFLRLFRLALHSVVPPPFPLYLPPKILTPVGFEKHVVLQMGGARRFDRRHSHRAPHTLAYTSTNMTSLQTTRNTCGHVGWKMEKKKVGLNLAKMFGLG